MKKILILTFILITSVIYSQEVPPVKHVLLGAVTIPGDGGTERIYDYVGNHNIPTGRDPGEFCKEKTSKIIVAINKVDIGEMEIFLGYRDNGGNNASCLLYTFETAPSYMVIEIGTPGVGEVYIRNKSHTAVKLEYKIMCE